MAVAGVKKWLLILLSAIIAVGGCTKQEETVAVVGGTRISATEFNRVLVRKLRLTGKKTATAGEKMELLGELVDRKLLYAEALRLGMVPTAAEVKAAVARAKAKFADGAAFEQSLKEDGIDRPGFIKETGENLTVAKVEQLLAAQVKPDMGEARNYYERHREDFREPIRYRVYLVQADGAEKAAMLRTRYRQDPAAFDRHALRESEQTLKELNAGAVLTAEGNFPDEMQLLLKKTVKGEVGGPVKTTRGYFLFRLLQRVDGRQKQWDQVKGDVVHLLYQEKKQQAVNEWLAQQHEKTKITIVGRL